MKNIFFAFLLIFSTSLFLSLGLDEKEPGFKKLPFHQREGSFLEFLDDDLINGAFPEAELNSVVGKDICDGTVLTSCVFTSGFGKRIHPIFFTELFHEGIDLAAKEGSEIRSPAEGIVVLAGRHGGYGLEVIIDHGYGWRSRYSHMSFIKVKRGQFVGKGDLLGGVGSTGVSTGPHLHFEVRYQNEPVDPRIYFPSLSTFKSMLAWKREGPQKS